MAGPTRGQEIRIPNRRIHLTASRQKVYRDWNAVELGGPYLCFLFGTSCDPSCSCFSRMKRLHSHTQLVRLQQVD